MDTQEFWSLIDRARGGAADPSDGEAVADQAKALLSSYPVGEIVAAQQVLWDLMADSYRDLLWAAAYLINGGCSDDGFEYFRGWLLLQGRAVFERVIADPDALAELPVVRTASEDMIELECEEALGIVWDAHMSATGTQLPADSFTIRYPALTGDWDFDDSSEIARRLPRLNALYGD